MNKAAIIIPTTGAPEVRRAMQSALAQTYPDIQVVVVVDGAQHAVEFAKQTVGLSDPRLQVVILPENVGADNYYGHRIYGGFSHLVNAHYVLFLDQDNFFDPGHVAAQVENIETNDLEWSYSLRKVCDWGGKFIVNDDCESLGKWPALGGYHLIDTNCYCLSLQAAIGIAAVWFGKWGQDRRVTESLMELFPKYAGTGLYTANYCLREDRLMFFTENVKTMRLNHPDGFPWAAKK